MLVDKGDNFLIYLGGDIDASEASPPPLRKKWLTDMRPYFAIHNLEFHEYWDHIEKLRLKSGAPQAVNNAIKEKLAKIKRLFPRTAWSKLKLVNKHAEKEQPDGH